METTESSVAAFPLESVMQLDNPLDRAAAQRAWTYFENNWNPGTGMVNAVDGLTWATWWDQGSALLGMHAARQLGLMSEPEFNGKLSVLLGTLEQLPLPTTKLPNKAYGTDTAAMRTLGNRPDPTGTSGWSALDLGRYLIALHTVKTHYPNFRDRINKIVAAYDLNKSIQDGWLWGSGSGRNGLEYWQEGRLGYEQYAAYGFQLWGLEANNALHNPPVKPVIVGGLELMVDQRDFNSSGASNHLTNDPYLLWAMELGMPSTWQAQIKNLLQVQANRYADTGILTAVNEDALDRKPYFLYYSVYSDGQSWPATDVKGKNHPGLRFLSAKAAFAWHSLFPENEYCQILRQAVQNLGDEQKGYLSGRYEDPNLGPNTAINVNTNAIILESLLYKAQLGQPIAHIS